MAGTVGEVEQKISNGVMACWNLFQGRDMFGLELIPIGIAGAAGIFGHIKSRKFVRRRLRYTSWVEKPYLGVLAGVVAAVLVAPFVGPLPLVGKATALIFGAGVGTGVSMGAREAKDGSSFDDD
jgi:hypothetical protein